MQTIIAYQHSAPTKGLLEYAALYNHGNDQTNEPLKHGQKLLEIRNIFIENTRFFLYFMRPPAWVSVIWLVHLSQCFFRLY